MPKYTIVGIGGDISVIPYLSKLKFVLDKLGETDYLCWDRNSSRSQKRDCFFCYTPSNKFDLACGYFFWFFKLFLFFLFKSESDRIYFVSRLDSALPIYLAGFFKRRLRYVYLDRDAYFMTYNFGVFQGCVKFLEKKVAAGAVKHLVPGRSRDFTGLSNVEVVENSPSTNLLECAEKISHKLVKDERFTIYVNGWLTRVRGAEFILNSVKMLDRKEFKVLVAGKAACEEFEELIALPIVEYVGEVSVAASLAYYSVADVVLAFYDPRIDINRRAEPNKWYDCIFIGVPFITNNGIETVHLIDDGCYCLVDYGCSDKLVEVLEAMARGGLSKVPVKNTLLPWDVKVSNIVKSL